MKYLSTRNEKVTVDASFAVLHGISEDGGLFVPESLPVLSVEDFTKISALSYPERAFYILKKYLTDFTDDELKYCTDGAYKTGFEDDNPAPIAQLGADINVLELWHGPTCAFKDLALQALPYLLTVSAKKQGTGKKTVILVATSGDTGKAALEGFKDVPDTEIIVFYPRDGVSPMQKLQMDSQEGGNVAVFSIKGNFDDAQTGVKKIFTNADVKEKLSKAGMEFSSANSINFGRLAPQIVYYVSAYCDMLKKGDDLSRGFTVTVPTGNFGNILAAFYAKQMGVPIAKLICASNENNVLTDFINTGVYDRNRPFHTTASPSMDILISSNLERMIYHLCDDSRYVAELQKELLENGRYGVTAEIAAKIKDLFFAASCNDDETLKTIGRVFNDYGYLIDTHTAVAVNAYEKYRLQTGDTRPALIASTASPYKFSKSVLSALDGGKSNDEFSDVVKLSELTGTAVPAPIASLKNAKVRFNQTVEKDEMLSAVYGALNI